MPTFLTRLIMKRRFPAPAKELLTRPSSYGGSYRMEDPAPDLHPVQIALFTTGCLSLLGIVVNVLCQILLACSEGCDPVAADRLLDSLLLCLGVFGVSVLGLIVANLFRRP